jgi:ribosomal protein L32
MKKWRKCSKTPEYCDVYALKAPHVSVPSYEEEYTRPSHVTDQTHADVGKRPSYLSVLP